MPSQNYLTVGLLPACCSEPHSRPARRKIVGRQRLGMVALLSISSSWACSGLPSNATADSEVAVELGTNEQALGLLGDWIWNSEIVPYCYQPAAPGSGAQPGTTEFDESVQMTEDAILKYEALPYAHIDFQGGGLCPNWSSLQVGIDPSTLRIVFANGEAGTRFCPPASIANGVSIGSTCHKSRETNDEVDIAFDHLYGGSEYTRGVTVILHELGHALGFAHEKDRRSDSVDRCSTDPTLGGGFNDGAPSAITEYDADSIMNSTGYCHWHDSLSPVDVAGLTYVYPGPQADRLVVPFSYQLSDALVTGASDDQRIEFQLRTEGVWSFHFDEAHWYRRSAEFGTRTQTAISSWTTLGTTMYPSTDSWLSAEFTDEYGRARSTATKRVRRDVGLASAILVASAY